jgi:hypothetical protein
VALSEDELQHEGPARSFWSWFEAQEEGFRDLEWVEAIYTELSTRWPNMGLELEAPGAGRREMVLTAYGLRSLFPAVTALQKLAPDLPSWEVVAFQQPKGFGSSHTREGLSFKTRDMWFCPTGPGGDPSLELGLLVFLEFEPQDREIALAAVWSILEAGLGELCVAEEIHHLEVAPHPPDVEEQIPLDDLPAYLEWRRRGQA